MSYVQALNMDKIYLFWNNSKNYKRYNKTFS